MVEPSLIDRVEAAEGPDRGLDREIARVQIHRILAGMGEVSAEGIAKSMASARLDEDLDAYTASLDAALTLVPEGWGVDRAGWQSITAPGHAGFELWQYRQNANGDWRHGSDERIVKGNAATPALALCAAALKALSA